jgi:hypothetical protein
MERNAEPINACHAKDRKAVSSLIQAIPGDRWDVVPGLATAHLDPITVKVWHTTGGSGINTYETVGVSVLHDEQDMPLYAGSFTAEELRLPNFIPKEQRLSPPRPQANVRVQYLMGMYLERRSPENQ